MSSDQPEALSRSRVEASFFAVPKDPSKPSGSAGAEILALEMKVVFLSKTLSYWQEPSSSSSSSLNV
ncbi:hypothetical protein COCSUDRAFT_33028 [Coccomyxa subellipsoidea C-169]|uniref:Uncharacterized protein n=1 Tax=Coccomyxa subellipsoidea (strain C-169) TaxID=574566 RepID=I0Z0Y0_COCSC|nr:hypothetical protein COCSUDRAFT_33028 [Coccomyxa subellipsoidea C-169]EIE24299.1 hypothetical protein COCSUDRAFT_33028 [Coccomyxa subellipsoidea C-169]|eukprot:XP_005648843.1 hypothetical protein COCSUDRAFT_33028 [Coccomyxa subellipsoidea C-169]